MNKKKIIAILLSAAIVTSGLFISTKEIKADTVSNTQVGVSYQAHVQGTGWQSWVSDGAEAGTDGKSLRLEALKINLTNAPAGAKINYQVHVQNEGWQSWVSDGAEGGTDHKSLRAEAVKITLDNLSGYSVQYRVHIQNEGWQPWVSDGTVAGTTGKSLRLEAIEIRIVKNNEVGVTYQAHVQNEGWQLWVSNGIEAGTEGQSLRLEALKLKLINAPTGAKINYQVHVQNEGWQSWVSDGAEGGTDHKSLRAEAVKITLDNLPGYSVQYRAHVQNEGWQPWVSDGTVAGTTGKSLRLEALQVKIVKKSVQSIAITKPANKLVYKIGDKLDIGGLEVTETYTDGTKAVLPITEANITGFDSSKAANGQVLTITAGYKTVTYTVDIASKVQTFTGYITTEDDFVNPKIGGIDPSTDTKYMILMKTMARSGLGIAVKENGTWKFYYLDGKFATDNTSGSNGKWAFDGTASQLDAWNLVQNTTKADHISVTVTGELTGKTATNTGADADGINYPVIKVSSLKETSVLNNIAITKPAGKLVYSVGDSLDISGLQVTGTYADNTTSVQSVKADNITGFDSIKPVSNQQLTITIGGKTVSYTVQIKEAPVSIAITKPASKLVYNIKDKLDTSGLEVTGTYADGSKAVLPITAANVTGFSSSKTAVGQVLTITAGGKTATYTVDINPVQSIAITKPANKINYEVGDKLDIGGLEVTETYADGTKIVLPITAANVTGFNSSKAVAGQVLTITAGGKTVTYTVNIAPKVQAFTGYITTEDDFAAGLHEDTAFMVYMKMMALSGLGITFQQDGKWVFYYIDGNIATNNSSGAGGKWTFDGTGSQLNAWKLVENQVNENGGANKMKPVPVKITGTLKGNIQTNPGPDADGQYFQVITVNSISKN